MANRVHLDGFADLMKQLNALGKSISYEEINKIHESAAGHLILDMKAGAPTSDIRESIGFITKNNAKYPGTTLIGPRYSNGYNGQLAHIFEFGTRERFTKDGENRGYITAHPFIRPAFDRHQNKIVTDIGNKIFKLVENKLK